MNTIFLEVTLNWYEWDTATFMNCICAILSFVAIIVAFAVSVKSSDDAKKAIQANKKENDRKIKVIENSSREQSLLSIEANLLQIETALQIIYIEMSKWEQYNREHDKALYDLENSIQPTTQNILAVNENEKVRAKVKVVKEKIEIGNIKWGALKEKAEELKEKKNELIGRLEKLKEADNGNT